MKLNLRAMTTSEQGDSLQTDYLDFKLITDRDEMIKLQVYYCFTLTLVYYVPSLKGPTPSNNSILKTGFESQCITLLDKLSKICDTAFGVESGVDFKATLESLHRDMLCCYSDDFQHIRSRYAKALPDTQGMIKLMLEDIIFFYQYRTEDVNSKEMFKAFFKEIAYAIGNPTDLLLTVHNHHREIIAQLYRHPDVPFSIGAYLLHLRESAMRVIAEMHRPTPLARFFFEYCANWLTVFSLPTLITDVSYLPELFHMWYREKFEQRTGHMDKLTDTVIEQIHEAYTLESVIHCLANEFEMRALHVFNQFTHDGVLPYDKHNDFKNALKENLNINGASNIVLVDDGDGFILSTDNETYERLALISLYLKNFIEDIEPEAQQRIDETMKLMTRGNPPATLWYDAKGSFDEAEVKKGQVRGAARVSL